MTYQIEFPDYPAADMPAVPATFVDTSWHNDVCPSFTHSDGYLLFVDYANPSMREFPDDTKRFTLHREGPNGTFIVAESDDWETMDYALAEHGLR